MDKAPSRFSKKRIILIATAIILFFAVIIPWIMPDGTEQYSGVKKDAAKAALDYINESTRGINGISLIGSIKLHVDSVVPADPQTVCNSPFSTTDGSSLVDDYSVYISRKTFFDLPFGPSIPTHVCRYPPSHH